MAHITGALGQPASPGNAGAATRNVSIDTLRLMMVAGVVVSHTNFLCGTESFACLATIQGTFRIGVPVFLLISGYFFFEAMRNRREWTWVKRILRLYAVWMIIYAPFWLIQPIRQGLTGDIPEVMVFGYFHLWYVIAVAGAAILTIFLSRLGLRWLTVVSVLLFAGGLTIQYALNYGFLPDRLVHHAVNGWLQRNFLFFGLPFFAIGYVIAAVKLETKISRRLALGLFVAGLALLLAEAVANYLIAGKIHVFELYAAVLIGAPALLILALRTNWQSGQRHLSKLGEAMFFVHILVLHAMLPFAAPGSLTLALLCLLFTVPLAAVVVWIDRRVKGVLL